MMQKEDLEKLLEKYKAGTCTPDEQAFVESWYLSYEDSPANPITESERLNDLEEVWNRLALSPIKKRSIFWPRIAAAAAIILMVGAGIFYLKPNTPTDQNLTAKNDIDPGGNKAYLTLANGKHIILTGAKNGLLANQAGTAISKTADGQIVYDAAKSESDQIEYNTMSTPRGGRYQLTLADGTNVWLNAASSIKYPTAFTGKNRLVEITGEAYFEVAHNAAKPFRVLSRGQTVEVLGTHFNINAYDDEPALKTTLLEGSVKVSTAGRTALLKPGEQSLIGQNDEIKVIKEANPGEATSWKNDVFQFGGTDIKSVMRAFSRWYDVDVTYQGNMPDNVFEGKISRKVKASEVFEALKRYHLNFKVEGRKVTVIGN